MTADEDSPPNDGAEVDTGPVGFDDVITLLLIAPNVGVTEAGVDGFPENFRNFEINNLFKLFGKKFPRATDRVNHFRDRTTTIFLNFAFIIFLYIVQVNTLKTKLHFSEHS